MGNKIAQMYRNPLDFTESESPEMACEPTKFKQLVEADKFGFTWLISHLELAEHFRYTCNDTYVDIIRQQRNKGDINFFLDYTYLSKHISVPVYAWKNQKHLLSLKLDEKNNTMIWTEVSFTFTSSRFWMRKNIERPIEYVKNILKQYSNCMGTNFVIEIEMPDHVLGVIIADEDTKYHKRVAHIIDPNGIPEESLGSFTGQIYSLLIEQGLELRVNYTERYCNAIDQFYEGPCQSYVTTGGSCTLIWAFYVYYACFLQISIYQLLDLNKHPHNLYNNFTTFIERGAIARMVLIAMLSQNDDLREMRGRVMKTWKDLGYDSYEFKGIKKPGLTEFYEPAKKRPTDITINSAEDIIHVLNMYKNVPLDEQPKEFIDDLREYFWKLQRTKKQLTKDLVEFKERVMKFTPLVSSQIVSPSSSSSSPPSSS